MDLSKVNLARRNPSHLISARSGDLGRVKGGKGVPLCQA